MGTTTGITGTLVGWGLEQTGGDIQTTLQKVNLEVYSHSECSSRHIYEVFPSNICAGVEDGGRGQCSVCIYGQNIFL